MATNKFLIFDEQGNEMMTDLEYSSASQRVSGVVPGLADASMHNKLYRQTSIMAHAIGRVLAEAGLDAPDTNAATLAANIKQLFCFDILSVYPVGSIYISASGVSPQQLFGGTWERISGKFILGADSTYTAGSTGGEASHTLSANEMPAHSHAGTAASAGAHTHTGAAASAGEHGHAGTAASAGAHNHTATSNTVSAHNHSVTIANNGAHTHTGTAASAGSHSHSATIGAAGTHNHDRGTMNITGRILSCEQPGYNYTQGAFYHAGGWDENNGIGANKSDGRWLNYFDASRSWTGYTSQGGSHNHSLAINDAGAHTHSITANSAGGHNHTTTVSNAGEHSHTITVVNNGAHSHTVTTNNAGAHTHSITADSAGAHTHNVSTTNTGGGAAHNNMPPYIALYVWKRTA